MMNGIPSGPLLGQIDHNSEVAGGRSFVAIFAKDGKAITICHKNGNGAGNSKINIGFSDVVQFAIPTVCGKAIVCYFKNADEVVLDTLTGQPWAGSLRRLRFAI